MKTHQKVKKSFSFILAVAVAIVSSCSTGTDDKSKTTTASQESTAGTDSIAAKPEFRDGKTATVYEHYLHLSNALIEGEADEAQSAAAALQTALSEAGNNKGADLAGKIASVRDIKAQRAELDALTKEVESVVKAEKLTGGVIYKQYCPMANDHKGAYWLSSNKDIRNPYFGDEMLNCGETKEEIK